ncbi:MAG: PKD domain-containing protein [Bacteroidota bacterium]
MKFFLLIIAFIFTLSGNVHSQGFPNPATLSTGQGVAGGLDPIWGTSPWYAGSPPNPMGLSYSPALINNNCAPGAWVEPSTLPPPVNNGNWITSTGSPCTGAAGYQYFRLTLDLPTDCNGNSVTTPGNYVLYFSGYVDNGISDIFINGNSTGISGGGFSPGTQLNITLPGPWVAGINYVDVLVYNAGGPYGLLLVANSAASAGADGDGDGDSDLNDQCPCQPGSLASGCAASIVGDTVICKGESTTLTSTGVGTYLWSTGSTNSSITVNPIVPTRYYVKVKVPNGFEDSASVNVNVNPIPVPVITGDEVICAGENTSLTAAGGGTYLWNTGSTNALIMVSPAITTNYKVVITNSFSCKDSLSLSVTVFPKPNASFTFSNKCDGAAIPFNSTSTINSPGIISSVFWDFGDNTFGTGTVTSHIFSSPGNYSVTLLVNSSSSCSDTIIQQVTVFQNPIAGFTHNDVCLGDSMGFTNTSSVSLPASISSYLWTFGDNGPTGNLVNLNHYYANAGAYNVALIATTADACADTVTIPVNVFDPPVSGFTFNNTCLLDSAAFTNTTLDPATGSVASWSWDFGDGSALNTTEYDPGHLFASPGNYEVTLVSYSSNLGCADTLKDSITIFPMPAANFSFTNVCLGRPMSFNDSSIVSGGSIAGRFWNFADGSAIVTIQNPTHTYTSPGTYFVSLIVVSTNGCIDTIIKSVVVHPLPIVKFNRMNVCDGIAMQFNNLSSIATTDTIQSWTWSFGDGSAFNSSQNPSHLYAGNGSYPVELLVISNFGCKDSISKTSFVNPNPVVNFTVNDTIGCEPLCISFQDLSTLAIGDNGSRIWNLGDGSVINNSQTFDHCYTNDSVYSAKTFNVTITVTSDSGCVSTLTKNNYITVYPAPVAGFSAQPETTMITDPVISITDVSVGANIWNWNFGDLTSSALFNPPPHTYSDTGSYTITLITSTTYGCVDSAFQTIIIEPDFVFYIPNTFTPDGDEINDSFCGKGIFINEFEMTIFDRWGNMIYKTKDINKPWDGKTIQGTVVLQADVYVYVINVIDFKNKKHNYKGIVTLAR